MTQSPIAYWKFNENSGTIINDSSGNNIIGNIHGSATWVSGKITSAVHFNEIDSYVDFGKPLQLPSGSSPRTISMWIKPDNLSNISYIFFYGSRSAKNCVYIGQDQSNVFAGAWEASSIEPRGLSFFQVNIWKHVAFTFDGNIGILYGNGIELSRYITTWNTILNITQMDVDWLGNHQWIGSVCETKIWDRTLSSSEILQDSIICPIPTGSIQLL